jgi:galactokinase
MNSESLKQKFSDKYGRPAQHVVRAPGRVNLIGEHTDYNDGFVLPIAIEKCTLAALAIRKDRLLKLSSCQADTYVVIDLDAPIEPGPPKWGNYCRGVAAGLLAAGIKLRGADILFDSDVPLGGGLSSSAALDVSTAMALLVAADQVGAIGLYELARLCQLGDHKFAGTPCGIMDQAISAMGRVGRALLLDCRDGHTEMIPFNDPSMVLLVIDTEVKHELNDGGYASRRAQCELAAKKLGIASLRDADYALLETGWEKLDEKEQMRSRHVIGEIARTLEAVTALKAGDYHRFGSLMYASHESLRDDYEVSCEELDAIVELARPLKGVYGARMTGGGFGGSAIILAEAAHAQAISQAVTAGFEKKFGRRCPVIATHAAEGAGILE